MALRRNPFRSRGGGGGLVDRVLASVPGKKTFGIYRFLPFFFALGAGLEFTMINWTVGETNFYRTFKKRMVKNAVGVED